MSAIAILKAGKEKSLHRRHPWVYAAAIARIDPSPGNNAPAAGDPIAVHDVKGRFLAWGAYSPQSQIRIRIWGFESGPRVDATLLTQRIRRAVEARQALTDVTNARRLVFGEADGLPGLVVDQYAGQLVVQIHSAGIDRHREVLLDALTQTTGCQDIYDRSDPSLRDREGLPAGTAQGSVLRGVPPPALIDIHEHDVLLQVDVRKGHKTGYYVDQRDNRRAVATQVQAFIRRHGRAPRVLNCFCYTGGFSLAAARAGAMQIDSVDASADALDLGQRQADRNGLGNTGGPVLNWHCADVFEFLRQARSQAVTYDIVILDPPKFATNAHQIERASRAYKDINLQALQLLNPGGLLFTFSCSGAISPDLFQKIAAAAVFDAGGDAILRDRLGAGADHPVRITHPESEYLKGLLLERI
jgi:23S rRNA (cytosine1962-C5)-methyltransferase